MAKKKKPMTVQEKPMTIHHRLPSSRGGKSNPENLSKVPEKMHQGWHTLFCNMLAKEIAKLINDVWIDPAYIFVCMPRNATPDEIGRIINRIFPDQDYEFARVLRSQKRGTSSKDVDAS